MRSLGTLGGTSSTASSVSFDGAVVLGSSKLAGDAESAAFIWDSAHGMRSLSSVLNEAGVSTTGWTLISASGISSDGATYHIVGTAINTAGIKEGFLANIAVSAVPEPSAYGVLGAGALALAAVIRLRSRHKIGQGKDAAATL